MNEQKDFYSVDEIATMLERHKATIWDRIKVLEIKTHNFKRDRKTYVAAADVERIRAVLRGKPWIAGEKKKSVA